ncbi:DUF1073 domain-containing protein [Pandoraea apista]|uniref:DUF1073 domain-containing protein n=1 Tax=Pandoraea apista TaxID=93218 RepID=UPI002F94E3B6
MIRKLIERFTRKSDTPGVDASREEPSLQLAPVAQIKINPIAMAHASKADEPPAKLSRIEPPKVLAGVVPEHKKGEVMAMDSALTPVYDFANLAFNGLAFPGYPYLAELTQRPEYRKISEVIAKEMTRKWGKVVSSGNKDKSDRIAEIEKELKRLNVRDLFRCAAEHDGFFGRAQIYIDVEAPGGTLASEDPRELETRLLRDPAKIKKDALRGFKLIEPMWTYPYLYNSDNPLSPDYYKPTSWFVMGKQVHSSRLLTMVSRPMPDMLKPAYNFGGLSLSQMVKPYVDNWVRTRDSVSDLIHSFSTSGIITDLSSILNGGAGEELFNRLDVFNRTRDNRGIMALNKESEEFFQFNTPLSGVDALQAQAQEQMASVPGIPIVKLLGIQPAGLNASSDGEIRVFYDHIHSTQEDIFADPIKVVLEVIQLSRFGDIDPEIGFEFEPLWQMDDEALSRIRKSDADAAAAYIEIGVISPEEERVRLGSDPNSGYAGINLDSPVPLDDGDGAEGGDDLTRT